MRVIGEIHRVGNFRVVYGRQCGDHGARVGLERALQGPAHGAHAGVELHQLNLTLSDGGGRRRVIGLGSSGGGGRGGRGTARGSTPPPMTVRVASR